MTGTTNPLIDVPKEDPKGETTAQCVLTEKYNVSKGMRWRQWLASISATLSMVAVGTVYGWTTTILVRLMTGGKDVPVKITEDESSWIVSLTVIGSMIGPFLGACLADRYGRKRCLLLSSAFYIAGWTIVFFAETVTALYLARVTLGVGVGMSYTTNPMYVSEVADVGIRGALGTLIAVNVFTGSLFTCSIGPWVSYKTLAGILLLVPVIFVCTFVWFPESPHFLAARGRRAEAVKALAFIKGIRDHEEAKRELDIALRHACSDDSHSSSPSGANVEESGLKNWAMKLRLMSLPSNFRALAIILGLISVQQLSGIFSTMQYLEVLFRKANVVRIDTNIATIIVLAVGLVSGTFSTATVEGAGRRPLLILSTLGSSLMLIILAVYLMLDAKGIDVSSVDLLPVVVVVVFQVIYQVGLGTLPNALIGEFFPTKVKGLAGAIITVYDGILSFAVSKLYQVISDLLGAYTVYYFFAGSCFLGCLMVYFVLPETKGRTFVEIQQLLATGARWKSHRNAEHFELKTRDVEVGTA